MSSTSPLGINIPNTLAQDGVENGLLKHAIDNTVLAGALQDTVFYSNADLIAPVEVDGKTEMPKGKMILDVTPKGEKAARDVAIALRLPISGGRYGRDAADLGYDNDFELLYTKAFANDYSNSISTQTFGIDYRELSTFNNEAAVKPSLAQWKAESMDLWAMQALLTSNSYVLTKAPISLTSPFNPNFRIAGLAEGSQPAYHSVAATYLTAIATSVATVVSSKCHLNYSEIMKARSQAVKAKIRKVNVPAYKQKMYMFFICDTEFDNLSDPGSPDSIWQYVLKGYKADSPQVFNSESIAVSDVLLVRNTRAPTIEAAYSSSAFSLFTIGYLEQGDIDNRSVHTAANVDLNVNFFCGENCLMIYEPEPVHYEIQKDDYGKYQSTVITGAIGHVIPKFDIDTPTDISGRNNSSLVVLTQRI